MCCILCNCGFPDNDVGHHFVSEFAAAQQSIKAATTRMLECSKVAVDPDDRRRYKAIHKRMVRLQRQWNQIEHIREVPLPKKGTTS